MSRAQRLKQAIEDEIVDGTLPPGTRLDEMQLAARFGVSRTPIREALIQLTMTGLVETRPRKGSIVSTPEPLHLLAMFETLAEIEAACGRLAARRLIPEDEAALKDALAACARAAAAGNTDAYCQENDVFHIAVYRACRNAFLGEQARQLNRRLAPFRRLQLRVRQRITQSLAEHTEIVDAIVSGDEVRAADALRAHVVVQGDRFSDLVANMHAINAAA